MTIFCKESGGPGFLSPRTKPPRTRFPRKSVSVGVLVGVPVRDWSGTGHQTMVPVGVPVGVLVRDWSSDRLMTGP